ncbi:two-component system, chemotaxis family, response regulator CheY [Fulvimarina manganoxydans]|uniref:Two-component system, chemotaxis family, response regulator CheY n=1 Tax=Fulvimarina manganoxydans TaxID=937218 RepID=A0A1W2CRT9_9HYPH|nr:response regulator [Fulvimarina manganoxydans]MCK5932639.1 response regulator [Fulvimarina manganoxydans]MEE2950796.1 response regulator [Pseudomonadota bacterium]SMC87957.1 two-component system, chemotaxis family, response regulator CheY [Fulvimarina manganoxydans]
MSIKDQLKVLIVDDHRTSRMLIRDALEQLGIKQIVFAVDGEEALKAMMATPCHIIISDFNMPKIDGIQLLKAIRSYPATKKVPFIILTSKGDRELVQKAAQLGVNNFLAKPITVPVLKKTIEAVVGRLQ